MGFTNTTDINQLIEFNTVDDSQRGSWSTVSSLIVQKIIISSTAIRTKAVLTILFYIPPTTS